MCGKIRESCGYEQKTSSYEQRHPEKTEQIRSQTTDKVKKKELNDNS